MTKFKQNEDVIKLKKCSKCGIEKGIECFDKRKISKDGLQQQCKECIKQHKKQYDKEHKEEKKEYHKQYYKENKEKINKRNDKYYEENKEKLKESRNNNRKKRNFSDPYFRLRSNISSTIANMLKSQNGSKRGESILKYLPYTLQQLKEHLEKQFEPWMNWENHGKAYSNRQTWQIDHIIPQSLLPYDSMEHPNFLKCWELSNLRPLEALENMLKKDKMII